MVTFILWLNGNASREVRVVAADELEAAKVFWAFDDRKIPRPPLHVWVRPETSSRVVCVDLDPATGKTRYVYPTNKEDA